MEKWEQVHELMSSITKDDIPEVLEIMRIANNHMSKFRFDDFKKIKQMYKQVREQNRKHNTHKIIRFTYKDKRLKHLIGFVEKVYKENIYANNVFNGGMSFSIIKDIETLDFEIVDCPETAGGVSNLIDELFVKK